MRPASVPALLSLRGRLGLRGRVILTFALGAALLSLVLSAYRIYRYDVLRWRDERPPDEPLAEGRLSA